MNKIKLLSAIALVTFMFGLLGMSMTAGDYFEYEEVSVKNTIPDDGFTDIVINTDDAISASSSEVRLEVIPTAGTEIRTELVGESKDGQVDDVKTSSSNGKLVIDYAPDDGWFEFNWREILHPLTLKVYLPEKEYQSISISQGNGFIDIDGFAAKDINISTDNGRIVASNLNSETATFESDNGKVEVSNVNAGKIITDSENGAIELNNVTGELYGSVDNGRITVNVDEITQSMDFESENGEIVINTKTQPTDIRFDVETDNGSVDILDQYDGDAVIGNGSTLVKLKASNGRIKVDASF